MRNDDKKKNSEDCCSSPMTQTGRKASKGNKNENII